MDFFIPIASLIVFSGLLFYFRWTDAKNADIRKLQAYIKSVEKEIEQYLRRKEKEFSDKIIPAEIAIDRMNNLANILQKKVEEFDRTLEEGETIYSAVRQEMGDIGSSLKDYRRMRSEFEDIEHKISEVISMRDMVAQGTEELNRLRGDMRTLKDEYDKMIGSLTTSSKTELESFFNLMQQELGEHSLKAKTELAETDGEIRQKIDELRRAAIDMSDRMESFKNGAEEGIVSLQDHFHNEITVLRGMAESNVEEIIDRWNKLKDQSEENRLQIEDTMHRQGEFFEQERDQVRGEIEKIQEALDSGLAERINSLKEHGGEIEGGLKNLESGLRTHLELNLDNKISDVRRQMEQTQQAFAAREEEIAKKLEEISQKAEGRISTAESVFYENLDLLKDQVHTVTKEADRILLSAENKIDDEMKVFEGLMKNKVDENMQRLENSFRNENEGRMRSSIEEIAKTLKNQYVEEYEKTYQEITAKSLILEQSVSEKISSARDLEKMLQETHKAFADEKETILLMAEGLTENRDEHVHKVQELLHIAVDQFREDMRADISAYFEDQLGSQKQHQDEWAHNYTETLTGAQRMFQSIKDEIDNISRDVKEIGSSTLSSLKSDSERLLEDTSRRLEDLKRDAENSSRDNKENYNAQLELARKHIGELKQELWSQEQKVREAAQKDFDRLNDRARDFERRFSDFLKKTEALERLNSSAEKFQGRMQELEGLKKDLEHISAELTASQKIGQDTISDSKVQNEVLENSLSSLAMRTEDARQTQAFLENSVSEIQKLEGFFERIELERGKAENIQSLLLQNLERYNDLREALDELESRKNKVDEMLLNIDSVNRMMGSTAEISDKIADLGHYALNLQEQLTDMQAELSSVVNEKEHLRSAINKVTDLESVIHHVEQERQSVERMLDYIAKASRMLKDSGPSGTAGSYEPSSDQSRQIIGLYRKDWSISEIAKKLGLSDLLVQMTIDKQK